MIATEVKTKMQIEELKKDWENDPCWDIEDTEGFDAYYDELKVYRLETEARWEQQQKDELFEKVDR